MKNTLVIGSGITGLTTALLLGKRGRKVTLIEKLPHIGGLLHRFTRNGTHFDTGFHFTGGFDNILQQMLEFLNLQDDVKPDSLQLNYFLSESGLRLTLPTTGLGELEEALATAFPDYHRQIHQYYLAEKDVLDHTPIFDLQKLNRINVFSQLTNYDHLTTDEFMDSISLDSRELRTILPIMSLCHGTPPCEAPFSYHCRCAFGLDSQLRAVRHGGDAFITGFQRELQRHGVRILTHAWIDRLVCSDAAAECTTAILNTEEALEVEEIYFTINPNDYFGLFPEQSISPRLRKRVERLLPTCSFVTAYGILGKQGDIPNQLTFHVTNNNLNDILLPGRRSTSTGIVISNDSMNSDTTITAFSTMFKKDLLEQLKLDPNIPYHRQPAYLDFKAEHQNRIMEDILEAHPELKGRLTMIETGTPLTCQRYSPPNGSAYGTRQPLAVSRLVGKLPIQNCYALGHHTYFPGILGSMLGAFIFAKDNLE